MAGDTGAFFQPAASKVNFHVERTCDFSVEMSPCPLSGSFRDHVLQDDVTVSGTARAGGTAALMIGGPLGGFVLFAAVAILVHLCLKYEACRVDHGLVWSREGPV